MSEVMSEVIKSPSRYLIHIFLKSFSAFLVGITASLVFHVFVGYGTFGFVFIGVVFAGLVLKFLSKASLVKVLVFDLAFIFILLLLKMYISLAPSA